MGLDRHTAHRIGEQRRCTEAGTTRVRQRTWSCGTWKRLGHVRRVWRLGVVKKRTAAELCTQIIHISLGSVVIVVFRLVLRRRTRWTRDGPWARDRERLSICIKRGPFNRTRRLSRMCLRDSTRLRRECVGHRLLTMEWRSLAGFERKSTSRRHHTRPVQPRWNSTRRRQIPELADGRPGLWGIGSR